MASYPAADGAAAGFLPLRSSRLHADGTIHAPARDLPIRGSKRKLYRRIRPPSSPPGGYQPEEGDDHSQRFIPSHFEAAWPDTILRAAEHHHIVLPYSCRGGRCSTCTARCLSGKVKMSINEVLTEKELKEGWILTCVGYAETDVVLSFGEDHEDTISPALQR